MADKKSPDTGKDTKAESSLAPMTGHPGFDDMREEMGRMMRRFLGGDWMRPVGELPSAAMLSAPKADTSETDGDDELTVELPGLDEKDIERRPGRRGGILARPLRGFRDSGRP